jgi:membrane peptidoglycan carboxypeptidase
MKFEGNKLTPLQLLSRMSDNVFFMGTCTLIVLVLAASTMFYAYARILVREEIGEIQKLLRDGSENWIKINDVPQDIKDGTVAAYDLNFYEEKYIKLGPFTALEIYIKVFVLRLNPKMISPITSEVVRNYFSNEINRQIKEFLLSIEVQAQLSKNDILEIFINTARYGYGVEARVIKAGAKQFFDKDISDLTLAEMAFLVGIPQAPNRYSPSNGKVNEQGVPLWQMRTEDVLVRMKKEGYISEDEYQRAANQVKLMQFK